LRAHLDDFHVEAILLENFPLLRGEKRQAADGNVGLGNTDLAPSFLGET
jgi:hypothetical protein